LLPDTASEQWIDARRRLVQDQQLRLMDKRAGELEPALHAPRELCRPTVAGLPQVHQLERLPGAPATPAREHSEQAREEIDVLRSRQLWVQRELLRHQADALPRAAPQPQRLLAECLHRALGGDQVAGEEQDSDRIASSAGTDGADERAALNRKGN